MQRRRTERGTLNVLFTSHAQPAKPASPLAEILDEDGISIFDECTLN